MNVDAKPTEDAVKIAKLEEELHKTAAECDKWISECGKAHNKFATATREAAEWKERFERAFQILERVTHYR